MVGREQRLGQCMRNVQVSPLRSLATPTAPAVGQVPCPAQDPPCGRIEASEGLTCLGREEAQVTQDGSRRAK